MNMLLQPRHLYCLSQIEQDTRHIHPLRPQAADILPRMYFLLRVLKKSRARSALFPSGK
ncbi:hypothetical protein PAXRUDRAFT_617865 [Paxillus rubicundulus Ve08.2h10]|uniref:Uncharacterized protein n=1 Tax=Paxillus rubicundulus Ve08.2h10 TaxID=930991 RepID=A0A0D0D503_9AGAM|nr:hypothetical protein PAXRUDRAFT_617865 [Paxillus rubicundulus Ve08.2h10]